MPNQPVIRTLVVEADATESRCIQRALHPAQPSRTHPPRWQLERAASMDLATKRLQQQATDVIVVGLRAHRENIPQRLQKLHKAAPHVPIVVIVDPTDERAFSTACQLAAASLSHTRHTATPPAAVVTPGRSHATERELQKLTPRESQILRLIAEGRSNKQVGEHLGISVKTVETHRTNFMRKLAIRSVGQLVRFAIRHHIIEA